MLRGIRFKMETVKAAVPPGGLTDLFMASAHNVMKISITASRTT